MSTQLKQLLRTQHYLFDWIAKVIINYKKLSKENITYIHKKKRQDDLEKKWEEANRLRVEIDMEATEENRKTISYFVQDHFSTAKVAYNETSDFLLHALSKFSKAGISVDEDDTSSLFLDATKPSLSQLRRIDLSKFSGVISEWEGFRNTFREMVDSNKGITNTLKFHYLKSCVSGTAANLITNLAPSEDNYSTAWKTLIDEYDDKRALIRTHVKSILCFPQMKTENLAELKRFRDTIATARAALANLGSPVEQWDHLLVDSMELKLSPETAREWNKSLGKSKEFTSYEQIYEFLTIWTHEFSDTMKAPDISLVKARVKSRPSIDSISVSTCVNCSGSHNLITCEDFLSKSIARRNALVKRKQVCFNCLQPGHFTLTCLSRSRCTHCNRIHHSLLHRAAVTAETHLNQAPEIDDSSRTVPTASSSRVINIQSMQAEVAPVGILLAIVSVDPYPSEGRCFQVRALLNQESTLSFISESLSQTSRTKRQSADLQIDCFGDNYADLTRSKILFRLGSCAKLGLKLTSLLISDQLQGPLDTSMAQRTMFGSPVL